jgi:hypothetical protein
MPGVEFRVVDPRRDRDDPTDNPGDRAGPPSNPTRIDPLIDGDQAESGE